MKRGAARFLVLVLGLAATGCTTDDLAWLKYQSRLAVTDHRRAQTDRLLAACRECLVVGGAEALCRSDLRACRACLDAGGAPEDQCPPGSYPAER